MSGRGGASPQSQAWRKEWLENKGQYVRLECGHVEDLHDRTIVIIKTFDGCEVLCERCNSFETVIGTHRYQSPEYSQDPMF